MPPTRRPTRQVNNDAVESRENRAAPSRYQYNYTLSTPKTISKNSLRPTRTCTPTNTNPWFCSNTRTHTHCYLYRLFFVRFRSIFEAKSITSILDAVHTTRGWSVLFTPCLVCSVLRRWYALSCKCSDKLLSKPHYTYTTPRNIIRKNIHSRSYPARTWIIFDYVH